MNLTQWVLAQGPAREGVGALVTGTALWYEGRKARAAAPEGAAAA